MNNSTGTDQPSTENQTRPRKELVIHHESKHDGHNKFTPEQGKDLTLSSSPNDRGGTDAPSKGTERLKTPIEGKRVLMDPSSHFESQIQKRDGDKTVPKFNGVGTCKLYD